MSLIEDVAKLKELAGRRLAIERAKDTPNHAVLERIEIERLRAEGGKIGTGDHIVGPNQLIWQITEERKNALRFSISGEMSPTCSCKYCKDAIATIRSMLQEAE